VSIDALLGFPIKIFLVGGSNFDLMFARRTRCHCATPEVDVMNFLRFLPIFCEKIGGFISKNNIMIKFLQKLAVGGAKKCQYFCLFFSAKIFLKSKHRSQDN
jgi:hypothetical protein